VYLDN